MANMDFMGFTFNGKHSYTDFNIYRTSDGSRYNDNLVPSFTEKVAEVPGGNGQYYFYTKHKEKPFSISIAFDNLSEEQYRKMRQWLDGKKIGDLIFDEAPYKVYSAKVTGTPQLKTICFDDSDSKRVYKGEGTIQFTCYHPYAHTPKTINGGDGRLIGSYGVTTLQWREASGLTNQINIKKPYNGGDIPSPFVLKIANFIAYEQQGENKVAAIPVGTNIKIIHNDQVASKITIQEECYNLEWDSKTGLVYGTSTKSDSDKKLIAYTGTSYVSLPVGDSVVEITDKDNNKIDWENINGYSLDYHFWYY